MYIETIEQYFNQEVIPTLTEEEKKLIWLQTSDYEDWENETENAFEDGKQKEVDFPKYILDETVLSYLVQKLLQAASDYTNSPIDKYLGL